MTKKELLTRFVEAVRKQRQLSKEIKAMDAIIAKDVGLGTHLVGDALVKVTEGGWSHQLKGMRIVVEVIEVPKEEFSDE